MEKDALLRDLGRRVGDVRRQKGISQAQLAHSIGKDQQSIQRLEAGNINPSYYYLHEIAAGLGSTVAELLSDQSK